MSLRKMVFPLVLALLLGTSAALAAGPGPAVSALSFGQGQPETSCGVLAEGEVDPFVTVGTPATFKGNIFLTPGCTGAPSFDWDFGDGSLHSSEQSPTHAYTAPGEYFWTFTVTHPLASRPQVSTGSTQACDFTCEAHATPASGLPPLPVDFTATATLSGACADPVTYAWDFGDGSAQVNDQNTNHVYSGEGVFTWRMTASANGLVCSQTGTVRVPCSTLVCTATAPTHGMPGESLALAGSVTPPECPDPLLADWDFGDGTPHAHDMVTAHAYASAGTFTWTFKATSGAAAQCTKTGSVTVVNPPVITLIKKVAPPFKIVVTGSNLQNGIRVFIDGTEWTSVVWKNTGKIQLTGAVKTAVPKGVTKTLRFLNPDGGEVSTTWNW